MGHFRGWSVGGWREGLLPLNASLAAVRIDMQEKVIARLRELAPGRHGEPGGGIHAT